MMDEVDQNGGAAGAGVNGDAGAGAGAPAVLPGLKAPDALRTIGEVATLLGIRQHVLRYWEEQFPTLSPVKRSGGRRYYRPEDIALLRTIHRLVDQEGYTLRGARLAIEAGVGVLPMVAGPIAAAAQPAAEPLPAAGLAGEGLAGPSMSNETLLRLRQVRRILSEALAAA